VDRRLPPLGSLRNLMTPQPASKVNGSFRDSRSSPITSTSYPKFPGLLWRPGWFRESQGRSSNGGEAPPIHSTTGSLAGPSYLGGRLACS